MDANRLRTGEKIAGIAGLALLIIMFFSWFGVPDIETGVPGLDVEGFAEEAGIDTSFNAWQSFGFIDIILFVTVLVAVGLAVSTARAQTVSLPVAASALTAGFGILSTLLILYRIIDPPEDASREFGVFLGLIAAAAIAYGGWRSMQEEGTTFAGEADRVGDRVGGQDAPPRSGDTAPPPPGETATPPGSAGTEPPPPPAGGEGPPPPRP